MWQGRFKSFPLDERYLYTAVRYVERNPVRAKLVTKAEEYEFSSTSAHIKKEMNGVLSHFYVLDQIEDWGKYLQEIENKEEQK